MTGSFPCCVRKARAVLEGPAGLEAYADLRELLCGDCEFYNAEEDEELECSSFKLLRRLVERGLVTPEVLLDAAAG
jgi:hypothetical protein